MAVKVFLLRVKDFLLNQEIEQIGNKKALLKDSQSHISPYKASKSARNALFCPTK